MTSTTLEIGTKGGEIFPASSFIRSLTYSAAAFAIFIRDEIVPFDGGAWFNSAGSSRRYGFEAGVQLDLRVGLSWKCALTALRATYRSYQNDLGDFSGKEVPGIPPLVFNNRLRYQSSAGFLLELSGEYTHRYPVDDANQYHVSSAFVVGASAGYVLKISSLELNSFVGVQNLANARYSASAFVNPATRDSRGLPIPPAYLEPGLPRNFFVGLEGKLEI